MAVLEYYNGEGFTLSHSIDKEPRDEQFSLHIHDCHELFCLVKGKVGYVVEGHKYKLRPGAVLLMRSSETHKLIVNESDEYERYVINFSTELFTTRGFGTGVLSPFFNRELGQSNLYTPKELEGFSPIAFFENMFKQAKILQPQDAVFFNLSALLSAINVAFLNKKSNVNEENHIITFINENLTADISINQIAAYAHLSPSQLSRVFKQLSGTSVHDYILSKRLILFHQKLKEGKGAVKASAECGFKDYSAFYRLYKKRFGVSPIKKSQES